MMPVMLSLALISLTFLEHTTASELFLFCNATGTCSPCGGARDMHCRATGFKQVSTA